MDKKLVFVLGVGLGVMVTIFAQFIMQACGVFEMEFIVFNQTVGVQSISDLQLENSDIQRYDEYLDTTFCKGDGIPSRERKRIYGGRPVDIEEVPWAVAIMRSGNGESSWSLSCAGTVIGSSAILSAAHCFPSTTNASMIKIAAGSTYIPQPEKLLSVKRIHNHENYNQSTFENDLSILELLEPLKFSEKIIPACLPTEDKPLRILEFCDVSGWGQTETGTVSQRLLHAQIDYLDDLECKNKFNPVDLDTLVCYGSDKGSDTCQGDSGASVICSTGTADITMGVSSFGKECGQGGVYARINYKWIIEKLIVIEAQGN